MSTLVLDIETAGEDWQSLDATTQEMLTRWLKRESFDDGEYEKAVDDVKNGLGFSPLTGFIVALGVWDLDRKKGAVYYQAPGQDNPELEEDGIVYKQLTEKEILEQFWKLTEKYTDVVTFNGRAFDAPYIIARSAVHHIRPTKNLMPSRYLTYLKPTDLKHIDLLDQLSFYGSVRKKGSLHLWCRAFGIESPKAGGVSGDDVAGLFKAGKCLEIAKYNVGDLIATGELYKRWKESFDV